MSRDEFNAQVKRCQQSAKEPHCNGTTYCPYHAGMNAELVYLEGRRQIQAYLATVPPAQLPSWAPAFSPWIEDLSLETVLRMSIPYVADRKKKKEIA